MKNYNKQNIVINNDDKNLLKQIKIFLNIVKTKNINKTAKQLFCSPSSISRTLQALESVLQTKLVDRRGCKGIEITADGLDFATYAGKLLQTAENVRTFTSATKCLHIVCHPIGFYPYITKILTTNHDTQIAISTTDKDSLFDKIAQNKVDIALYPLEIEETLTINTNLYDVIKTKEYEICLYMNKKHKLAKIPVNKLTIEDLNQANIVPENNMRIRFFQKILSKKNLDHCITNSDLQALFYGVQCNLWTVGIGKEFEKIFDCTQFIKKKYTDTNFYSSKTFWYIIAKKEKQNKKIVKHLLKVLQR